MVSQAMGKWARWVTFGCFVALGATRLPAAEFVLKFKNQSGFVASSSLLQKKSLKVLDHHQPGQLVLVASNKNAKDLLTDASLASQIEYIVPNIKFAINPLTSDPEISKQWALEKVRAEKAWTLSRGSRDVVVAVIDTGIDWTHEDLAAQIWHNPGEIAGNGVDDDKNGYVDDIRGWDFRDNDNDPQDETSSRNPGHGTHCAGIVGAEGDNGIGISGMAPIVTLMPVRFLGADGSGDLMAAAKAIDYATANGADVISASWGAAVQRSQVKPILEAIERAGQKGVVFVAAAANDGKSNDNREVYPANAGFDNVISVAASGSGDQKPSWSNYGISTVDLASPGENIYSTVPGNKYQNLSGTSMATPLVSGLVALMLAHGEQVGASMKPIEMKAILQASAESVKIETACGCRVSALGALEHISKHKLTVVPNAATLAESSSASFWPWGGEASFEFSSSKPDVAKIDEAGKLTTVAKGQTQVIIKDSLGVSASSHTILVGKAPPKEGGGQCPLPNPQLCEAICRIVPTLPWCQQSK